MGYAVCIKEVVVGLEYGRGCGGWGRGGEVVALRRLVGLEYGESCAVVGEWGGGSVCTFYCLFVFFFVFFGCGRGGGEGVFVVGGWSWLTVAGSGCVSGRWTWRCWRCINSQETR